MTRSKRSSRNSAKAALSRYCVIALAASLCGCFFSAGSPTYTTQNIAKGVQDLASAEYKIELSARLVGSTLWLYMPVSDLFIPNPNKEKYPEKFKILKNTGMFKGAGFVGEYHIKPVPVSDKTQDYKINKEVSEKMGTLWKIVRRALFSIAPEHRDDIKFVVLVVADVKNGFEVKETFYIKDLKKVSYNLMSIWEFQHRVIQDSSMSPLVIGDRTGRHVEYRDVTLPVFVLDQIQYRISLKFQKPEVEQNVDIDREVAKIIAETLRMYDLKEIKGGEFKNLDLNTNVTLSYRDIWGKPTKK